MYRPLAVLAARLPVACALLFALWAPRLAAQDDPDSGPGLYKQHCSGCHGANGDGKGTTPIPIPARSFREGRFAFGDSPEQLQKTIARGIKGRTEMPSFEQTLTEEQRKKIVQHVLTLVPARAQVSSAETRMVVADRPQIARGIYPSLGQKLPERPRAVMIGYPGGLSLQFRTDDVRLLAAFRGEFIERTDWGERGGLPLKPLGDLVHLFGGGDPEASFAAMDGEKVLPLTAKFTGTWIRGGDAGVSYRLETEAKKVLGTVEESARDEKVKAGPAFTRRFSLKTPAAAPLRLQALAGAPNGQWRHQKDAAAQTAVGADGSQWIEWRLMRQDEGPGFTAILIRSSDPVQLVEGKDTAVYIPFGSEAAGETVITVTQVSLREWTAETLAEIAKEVKP